MKKIFYKLTLIISLGFLTFNQAYAVSQANTVVGEYSVSDKKSQNQVFEIINYFSNHYPYSQPQFNQFFHTSVKLADEIQESEVNPATEKMEKVKYSLWKMPKNSLISTLEIKQRPNSQQLNITLRKPICYEMNLIDTMSADNYVGVVFPPIGFFARTMDNKNNMGSVFVFYKTHMVSNTICIPNLSFDTAKPFDKNDKAFAEFSIVS